VGRRDLIATFMLTYRQPQDANNSHPPTDHGVAAIRRSGQTMGRSIREGGANVSYSLPMKYIKHNEEAGRESGRTEKDTNRDRENPSQKYISECRHL
jgi:hypothetical protein